MKLRRPAIVLVAAAAACAGLLSSAVSAAASPAGGRGPAPASPTGNRDAAAAATIRWGKAQQVPGLAALNQGYNAAVDAAACWTSGGCVVGGSYSDKHGHGQAFVAREWKGRWGNAQEVPGTAALNKGGNAVVSSVSCAHTSVCVAVGTYTNQANGGEWFTVTERSGRWGTAKEVPVPSLTGAGVNAVWCAVGVCVAGGGFTDSSGAAQAWVETQVGDRWQPAVEVPGLAALNVGGAAGVSAVTCASAGNCVVGGQYAITGSPDPFTEPFVANETNGHWGTAREVPGVAGLNEPYPSGDTTSIACPSAGNCTAAGYNAVNGGEYCVGATGNDPDCGEAFVVNERHGTWGQAIDEPFFVGAVTCPAVGDCVAVGAQSPNAATSYAALIDETNGRWGATLVFSDTSNFNAVACASVGYCDGVGVGNTSAFVISQWHGKWGRVVTPAGLPRATSGWGNAMGCPPKITLCVAGGSYLGPKGGHRAFIASQTG